eukprot:1123218_1
MTLKSRQKDRKSYRRPRSLPNRHIQLEMDVFRQNLRMFRPKNALSSSKNRNIQTPVRPRRRTHVDSSPEIECIDLSFSQESLKNYGEIDKVELKSSSFPAKIDISQSQEIQGPSPPPPVLVSRSKSNVP